jgi:hypothetical protein
MKLLEKAEVQAKQDQGLIPDTGLADVDLKEFAVTDETKIDAMFQTFYTKVLEYCDLDLRRKELKKQIQEEEIALSTATTEQGLQGFKTNGISVEIIEKLRVWLKVENKPRQLEWLRENGASYLIKETVHPGTFKAYIKEKFVQQNCEIPDFISHDKVKHVSLRPKPKGMPSSWGYDDDNEGAA